MPNEQKNKAERESKPSSQKSQRKQRNDDLVSSNDEVVMRLNQMLLDISRSEVEGYDPPDGTTEAM